MAAQRGSGRAPDPAAAADLPKQIGADRTVTTGSPQALREIHLGLAREELGKGQIPLSLTSYDRCRWAEPGMTLKQREPAATLLVRQRETEYRALTGVVHLIALLTGGEAGR